MRHFGEGSLIEKELRTAGKQPWRGYAHPKRSIGMTERVVEVPWALTRYQGEQNVLDIGTAFASRVWVRNLRFLGAAHLVGVDLADRKVAGIDMVRGDVRDLPFPAAQFDLAFCISTLEHIGENNRSYYQSQEEAAGDDVVALRELRRVLRPGGRLIVSVPFGLRQELGWQKQYDLAEWDRVLRLSGFHESERATFSYSNGGWVLADPRNFPALRYRDLGAPAATGVLCSVLLQPQVPGQN